MSADTKLAEALKVLQPAANTILSSRPMDFDDATYQGFQELLDAPMREVLNVYEGRNSFLLDIRRKRDLKTGQFAKWTPRQSRAVANILRRELRNEGNKATTKNWECWSCKMQFHTWDDLKTHKIVCQGNGSSLMNPAPQTTTPVLPDYVPVHNIDLRLFPAARFAVEDKEGKLRFIIITELKRRTRLAGRFVWTKFRYANEYLEKGDRTVREQAGDTKKLIGKQRVGQPVYFGEEEDLIKLISEDPTEAMIRYGKEKGSCAYCGRSLTDPESRLRGIGPDCWEDKHVPYVLREVRKHAAAQGWAPPTGSPVKS
jgi:hypothetical protein